jgi:YhcH/YjgK/YiaL family protein
MPIMIVTDLEHIERQAAMTPGLCTAVDFLRQLVMNSLPEGRVEIDGHRVFATVQRYETLKTDAPKFECHRTYIDVQFIVSGEEVIGWAPAEQMKIVEPYEADKDICFGTLAGLPWTPVLLRAGQVAVLFPEDAHAPKLAAGIPSPVMKIVIKVAV